MPYISQDVFFDGLWAMVAMVIIPTWTSLLADHPLVEKPYIFTISQAKKMPNKETVKKGSREAEKQEVEQRKHMTEEK